MSDQNNKLSMPNSSYKYGFVTEIEKESFPCGINETIVEAISEKKKEPAWMLDFRIKAFRHWKTMREPHLENLLYDPIDYQAIRYFSAPKEIPKLHSIEEASPEMQDTLRRLGIPLGEQQRLLNVAVDVVFDSVSLGTSLQKKLAESGVVLCPISEAIHTHEDIVKKYLGSVVPFSDNFFAALNSAVFSDGSFVYIPKGVRCPMDLSTYFRLNDKEAGQFERTLIIAEDDSYVSYLEGCTAPAYNTHQLHAAVVELVAGAGAEIRYATVQNWYAGDPVTGKGGVYNFVTKRGLAKGTFSKISWTQVEAGAAITWKYPGCILRGDQSSGEFYSVSLTNGCMQADTGTKMIHEGKNTRSTILSKSIAADGSKNTYRGLVKMASEAKGAKNYTQCDSLLVGDLSTTRTIPTVQCNNSFSQVEHEASTSRLSEDQLFYARSRGFTGEEAISLIVSGFCDKVLERLPLEFAQEAKNLLSLKLENSVG
jgi:Fe-S cluster assembly protein SufB